MVRDVRARPDPKIDLSGYACRLRRSTQHLLEVYSQESGILESFLALIQAQRDLVELRLSDWRQVGSSREILSQQKIGAFATQIS